MNSHLGYFDETCSTCLVAHIMAGYWDKLSSYGHIPNSSYITVISAL